MAYELAIPVLENICRDCNLMSYVYDLSRFINRILIKQF